MGDSHSQGQRFCERCGAAVKPGDQFCWRCGARLASAAGTPSPSGEPSPVDAVAHGERDTVLVAPDGTGVRLAQTMLLRRPARTAPRTAGPRQEGASPEPSKASDDASGESGHTAGGDVDDIAVLPPSAFDEPVRLPEEAPTPVAWLTRESTGERMCMSLPCVVGRGSAATCRIEGNDAISREHARIYLLGDACRLRALSSTNPTYVDGRLVGSDEDAELHDGSVIELADEDFVFHTGEQGGRSIA